jgi:hypothetical protein
MATAKRCVADEFLSRSSAERRVDEINHLYPRCAPRITRGKTKTYMHDFKVTVSGKAGCPVCPRPLNEGGTIDRPRLGSYRGGRRGRKAGRCTITRSASGKLRRSCGGRRRRR